MHFKAIYAHLIMGLLGLLAYVFANVDSQNGFYSVLLPTVLILTILYFISLIIYLIHKARHPGSNHEHLGLLSEAVQELGKRSDSVNLESVLARTSVDAAPVATFQTASPKVVVPATSRERVETQPDDQESDPEQSNHEAWEDEENWTGPDWFAVYFSKKDSRSWVPKRIPLLGWTPNLGQPGGFLSWLVIWSSITVLCVLFI